MICVDGLIGRCRCITWERFLCLQLELLHLAELKKSWHDNSFIILGASGSWDFDCIDSLSLLVHQGQQPLHFLFILLLRHNK